MPRKVKPLAKQIAEAIDDFNADYPVTVLQILGALEQVRFGLTEAFLKATGGKR